MATGKDWQRLADFVSERRADLGMTQEDVRAAGGPSTATQRLSEGNLQSRYQPVILGRLETALKWERGSVRRILAGGDPVLTPDALAPALLSAAPEPVPELPADDDADAMESAVIVAATPRKEREVWAEIRRNLQSTPAGAALLADAAQARAWPAGSAPLKLTEEAVAVLDATPPGLLLSDPAGNAAARLVMYSWHKRVQWAAAGRAILRPTRAVRRAG